MKRNRATLLFLAAAGLGVLAGVVYPGDLFGKATSPYPVASRKEGDKPGIDGQVCDPKRQSFPHKKHMSPTDPKMKEALKDLAGGNCGYCHQYVSEDGVKKPGEEYGDIRRPTHKTCLQCHGVVQDPKIPSFYETDPKKRVICGNCHANQLDKDGKIIEGSYNDMTKALPPISYGLPAERPCDFDYGFDFSHAAHSAPVQKTVDCAFCHKPIPDCTEPGKKKGDPAVDHYEYVKDEKGQVKKDKAGNPIKVLRDGLPVCAPGPDGKPFEGPNHNRMISTPGHPQCWSCHNKDGSNPAAAAKATPDKCESCHKMNQATGEKGFYAYYMANRDKWASKFTHKTHLEVFATKAKYKKLTETEQCDICHDNQSKAASIADIAKILKKDLSMTKTCGQGGCHDVIDASSCFKCHDESQNLLPNYSHGW